MLACANFAHAQQRHADGLDDVLEHVPMASLLVLKASGVNSQHDWPQFLLTAGASYVLTAGITKGLKWTVDEWRPDNSDTNSFPSGHTAMAFSGATVLRHEYGEVSPWITVAGYSVATFVAVDRVAKKRHHWYDVTAGAAIGVAATEASYWLSEKLFDKKEVHVAFTGQTFDLVIPL
jgi:membrane-associated phospholipid phosphatase